MYRHIDLKKEHLDFLMEHGQIHSFKRGEYYISTQETKQRWCILLEGLIAFEVLGPRNQIVIERIGLAGQYFSGTKHIYSTHGEGTAVHFLRASIVYEIRNKDLQEGINSYPEISQLYHILKQHQLDIVKVFLRIHKLERNARLSYLYWQFPELWQQLTIRQLCSLLDFTNTKQYYRALAAYYRQEQRRKKA